MYEKLSTPDDSDLINRITWRNYFIYWSLITVDSFWSTLFTILLLTTTAVFPYTVLGLFDWTIATPWFFSFSDLLLLYFGSPPSYNWVLAARVSGVTTVYRRIHVGVIDWIILLTVQWWTSNCVENRLRWAPTITSQSAVLTHNSNDPDFQTAKISAFIELCTPAGDK